MICKTIWVNIDFQKCIIPVFLYNQSNAIIQTINRETDQRRQLYSPLCVRHLQVLLLLRCDCHPVPRSYTLTDLTKLVKTFTEWLLHASDDICYTTFTLFQPERKGTLH